jgi:hypothetical protein
LLLENNENDRAFNYAESPLYFNKGDPGFKLEAALEGAKTIIKEP